MALPMWQQKCVGSLASDVRLHSFRLMVVRSREVMTGPCGARQNRLALLRVWHQPRERGDPGPLGADREGVDCFGFRCLAKVFETRKDRYRFAVERPRGLLADGLELGELGHRDGVGPAHVDGVEAAAPLDLPGVQAAVEVLVDGGGGAALGGVMPGIVSLPHGWGHGRPGVKLAVAQAHPWASINDLTDEERVDALSGNTSFSGVEVEVVATRPDTEARAHQ
jgi:hypothetical protein